MVTQHIDAPPSNEELQISQGHYHHPLDDLVLGGLAVPQRQQPQGRDAPVDGVAIVEVVDGELRRQLLEDLAFLGVLLAERAHLFAHRQVAVRAQVAAVDLQV